MTGTALIVEDHPEQADLVARILIDERFAFVMHDRIVRICLG